MAVAFVAAGAANSTVGTSSNLEYPAGLAADDILLICSASSGLTSPSATGFVTVGAEIEGTSANLQVLWKRATGSESGTIAVAQSGASVKLMIMLAYRGVIATDPPYEAATAANGADVTTACPDLTTLGTNRKVIMVTSKDATQATPTTPNPWAERANVNTATSNDQTLHIFDILATATGAVTGPDVTYANSNEWFVLGFGLIPASGGSVEATVNPAQATITAVQWSPSTNPFSNVRIREVLINEAGAPVTNQTGMHVVVWYSGIPTGPPDVSLSNATTDTAGSTSWSLPTGSLIYNQGVFYIAHDGHASMSVYTCARMIPTYS